MHHLRNQILWLLSSCLLQKWKRIIPFQEAWEAYTAVSFSSYMIEKPKAHWKGHSHCLQRELNRVSKMKFILNGLWVFTYVHAVAILFPCRGTVAVHGQTRKETYKLTYKHMRINFLENYFSKPGCMASYACRFSGIQIISDLLICWHFVSLAMPNQCC